jgi:hypothetical protein
MTVENFATVTDRRYIKRGVFTPRFFIFRDAVCFWRAVHKKPKKVKSPVAEKNAVRLARLNVSKAVFQIL